MDHVEVAISLFNCGYNCAQSTAAAFAADYGLDPSLVLRATAGFGGGIGGLRETCGAISGMVYVAGLHHGAYAPDDLDAKSTLYALIKGMVREFEAQHGSTNCRELLERAGCVVPNHPSERTEAYYAVRPCARLVGSAVEIVARTLALPE